MIYVCRFAVDYDVVAWVNGKEPPFSDVLDDFEDVLMMQFPLEEKDIKKTTHSLQFTLENVEFDLLVATNLASSGMGVYLFFI